MLTFADQPLLLADPQGELSAWIDKYCSLEDMRMVGLFENGPGWSWLIDTDTKALKQTGMPICNWPAPPRIKLNTLYFPPTGASRWGFGLFLVDRDTLEACEANSGFGYSGPLSFKALDKNGQEQSVSITFHMLPPRMVSAASDVTPELFILPLVDIRYFWQWRNFGDGSDVEGWGELIAHLGNRLGVTIDASPTVNSKYTWRPDLAYLQQNMSAASVLDSVCTAIGRRFVFNLGNYYVHTPESAKNVLDRNADILKQKIAGFATSDIEDFKFNLLAEQVEVFFPKTVTGVNNGAFYSLTATIPPNVDFTATHDNTTATLVNYLVAECDSEEATPTNESALQAAADKMAGDYYAWRIEFYDLTFPGIVGWYSSGFDNAVWLHFAHQPANNKEYSCFTRVQSLPLNFEQWEALPETAKKFEIVFAVLTEDLVYGGTADATEYTTVSPLGGTATTTTLADCWCPLLMAGKQLSSDFHVLVDKSQGNMVINSLECAVDIPT